MWEGEIEFLELTRALHVVGVVIWIGGVAMVTTVIFPALRACALGQDAYAAFEAVESRFVWQARGAILLVGLTGLYMLSALGIGPDFYSAHFWWIHAMVLLWLVYAFILFIAEPFLFRRRFKRWVDRSPSQALAWLHAGHGLLLLLSVLPVLAAVAGSHGWQVF